MKLTAIILTWNEQVHIERCLRSLEPVTDNFFIVDSFSTDGTVEIARALGAEVVQRRWKNYADQFQWAIENCESQSDWLMRMDADEYLDPEAQEELRGLLATVPEEVSGVYVKRKVLFEGRWIRHGGFYPLIVLRLWRSGMGRIERRWMDEHIVLPPGARTVTLNGHLVDDNRKGLTFWIEKHNRYATREAVDLLGNRHPLFERDERLKQMDDPQAKRKRIIKDHVYSKLPPGLRAFLYFVYRYVFRLGFLDGAKGLLWHFMQGFWYRLLVDMKIMEIEERSQGDVAKIRKILWDEHGISL